MGVQGFTGVVVVVFAVVFAVFVVDVVVFAVVMVAVVMVAVVMVAVVMVAVFVRVGVVVVVVNDLVDRIGEGLHGEVLGEIDHAKVGEGFLQFVCEGDFEGFAGGEIKRGVGELLHLGGSGFEAVRGLAGLDEGLDVCGFA